MIENDHCLELRFEIAALFSRLLPVSIVREFARQFQN